MSSITPSSDSANPWGNLLTTPPLPYAITAVLRKSSGQVQSSPDGEAEAAEQQPAAAPATKVTKLWGPLTEARLVEVSSTETEVATGVFVFNNQDDALDEDDEGFAAQYVCGLDSDGLTAAGFQKIGTRFMVFTRPTAVTRPSAGSASARQSASKAASQPSSKGGSGTRQVSKVLHGKRPRRQLSFTVDRENSK